MTQRNPWRVFIIHGFDASPEEHWFPWLESQLQERGIQAIRLRMPESSHPDFDRWQATMREAIGQPDEHTILVAHSLGTISVLHFASQSGTKRLGGIVLVSGFAGRIPGFPLWMALTWMPMRTGRRSMRPRFAPCRRSCITSSAPMTTRCHRP